MKKTLIALAAVAAVGAASAQVTVYGKVAAGITTSGSGTSITSGGYEGSRLGVKGSTDLGSGMTGSYVVEGGLNLNAPTVDFAFNRVSNVSVAGGFGTVTMGTVWSNYDNYFGTGDAMEYNGFSPVGVIGTYDVGNNGTGAIQGAIQYVTPAMSGFQVTAQIAPNAGIAQTNYNGVALTFNQGPVSLSLTTQDFQLAATGNVKSWMAGGSYDLGVATVYAATNATSNAAGIKEAGSTFGLKVPMGAGYVTAGYAMNTSTLANVDTKNSGTGIQYIHNWNKSTVVYGGYKSLTVSTVVTNTMGAGVRYNF